MNNESKHFIENLHKAAEHNESAQFHVVSMSSSFDQTLTFFKTIKTFIQNKKNTFVSLFNLRAAVHHHLFWRSHTMHWSQD